MAYISITDSIAEFLTAVGYVPGGSFTCGTDGRVLDSREIYRIGNGFCFRVRGSGDGMAFAFGMRRGHRGMILRESPEISIRLEDMIAYPAASAVRVRAHRDRYAAEAAAAAERRAAAQVAVEAERKARIEFTSRAAVVIDAAVARTARNWAIVDADRATGIVRVDPWKIAGAPEYVARVFAVLQAIENPDALAAAEQAIERVTTETQPVNVGGAA